MRPFFFVSREAHSLNWISFQFWRHVQGSTYTIVHSVTFNVPQSGPFEFILPPEERDQLQPGDIMGYSTVYNVALPGILPYSDVTCAYQPTICYVQTHTMTDTMNIATCENCRLYSMQAIFNGKILVCCVKFTKFRQFCNWLIPLLFIITNTK